jgi:hypothetical protein
VACPVMFNIWAMAASEYSGIVPAPYTGRAVLRRDSCRGAVGACRTEAIIMGLGESIDLVLSTRPRRQAWAQ